LFLRNTSSYPDDEVKRLVEFATKGVNMKKVCVNVKGSSHRWGGRAYSRVPSMSNAPPTARRLLSIRIGSDIGFPIGPKNYHGEGPAAANPNGRFPFYTLHNWQELLVHLAAHEARHVYQFDHRKRISEVDCERFAVKALERFRQESMIAG
jgi:hypothetical protein